jgi:hypothetical protein
MGEGDTGVAELVENVVENRGAIGIVGLVTLLLTGLRVVNSAMTATTVVLRAAVPDRREGQAAAAGGHGRARGAGPGAVAASSVAGAPADLLPRWAALLLALGCRSGSTPCCSSPPTGCCAAPRWSAPATCCPGRARRRRLDGAEGGGRELRRQPGRGRQRPVRRDGQRDRAAAAALPRRPALPLRRAAVRGAARAVRARWSTPTRSADRARTRRGRPRRPPGSGRARRRTSPVARRRARARGGPPATSRPHEVGAAATGAPEADPAPRACRAPDRLARRGPATRDRLEPPRRQRPRGADVKGAIRLRRVGMPAAAWRLRATSGGFLRDERDRCRRGSRRLGPPHVGVGRRLEVPRRRGTCEPARFPTTRLRRLRRTPALRRAFAETRSTRPGWSCPRS